MCFHYNLYDHQNFINLYDHQIFVFGRERSGTILPIVAYGVVIMSIVYVITAFCWFVLVLNVSPSVRQSVLIFRYFCLTGLICVDCGPGYLTPVV